eukprot:TRINITY_DN1251_c0_g2_i6.p1 TRINITY_DN1251_c0_g2~~TRINITY_DN1251_c0_g2_i6.p1  ORF type:complete len:195 (-),score=23.04 TRINITY_DN1251_c0_g2_i6:164-748(-)
MKRFPKYFFLWVDFSKAFDSISHNYILINKSVSDIKIPIQWGSRQGDPISGYLFNIVLDVLNLGFKFNGQGVVNQAAKFLDDLPSKYLRIKKLNVISKAVVWSQCESFFESEWVTADQTAHRFCFSKSNKTKPKTMMNAHKSSFPISKGGFDLWVPSKRTEAAIASLRCRNKAKEFFVLLKANSQKPCVQVSRT